ncbi:MULTISPECIES: TRAP transporter small permease [Halomonas]|uniref:TRAP transporter small permease n=1 Tax=Halomonas TaxID=2745 RepID=UPI001C96A175|nr:MULTISPECIES: TRAP transporter small permease [Halomonas]MBY5983978.1 TRAP transporter small permease [Halomonas sp. DP5Y7-2]MBY6207550.1 TRAP transporter small permease [Halomonas sp. DP3Y7-2]MBY6228359.1 TRAP transporter small permease [Halomonas sp. DP3Y7-1]MCA0916424.1 TRAP transporter small permease [Halomonas denitrificans]
MLDLFFRFERAVSQIALYAAVLMLVASVSLGFYQVLTRFVFDAPSTWSEVMARSTMIWCVFMGAAATFRGGYMMAVEVIYKLVPAPALKVLESVIALCCMIVLAILVIYGYQMTLRVQNQMLSGVGISIAWIYAAIPIGAAFSLLSVITRLVAQLTGRETIGVADAEAPLAPPATPPSASTTSTASAADEGRKTP